MAALISILVAAISCLFFGRFSEIVLVAGLCCLIGLFIPVFRTISVFVFTSALSLVFSISSDSAIGLLAPAFSIWLIRCALKIECSKSFLWVVILPVPILFWHLPNRDFVICSLLAVASTMPIYRTSVTSISEQKVWRLLSLLIIIAISSAFAISHLNVRMDKSAVLQSGVWAQSSTKLDSVSTWNIESMYSYSEFAELIRADSIPVDKLSSEYSEAWLITPTKPIPKASAVALLDWIHLGGTLFIITDHTDLFGHARVVNELLYQIGVQTSYSAFFPLHKEASAQLSPGSSIPLKTANIQTGQWLWPRLTACWFNETADYSNKNFFGPLRPSADDGFGRRIVSGYRNLGKGNIILLGDSTILANFAVYQPGIISTIERLRCPGVMSALIPIAWVLLVIGVGFAVVLQQPYVLAAIPIIGLWSLLDFGRISVQWPNFEWWSGNKSLVMEWRDPRTRISTAYSVASMSGRKPRWTDDIKANMHGFWISEQPAPNDQWHWIDITKRLEHSADYDHRWDPLLKLVTKENPSAWNLTPNLQYERIGGVWTDDVVGDWWFDQGISMSKRLRLQAWLAWLNKKAPPDYGFIIRKSSNYVSTENIDYIFKSDGKDPIQLKLPALKTSPGQQVYLGKGVSADVVDVDGKSVLLGSKPLTEAWDCPSSWTLVPQSKK